MKTIKEGGENPPLVSIILAGGGGKRLFPISTEDEPKYLIKVGSNKTLLEEAKERAVISSKNLKVKPNVIIVCNFKQVRKIRRALGTKGYTLLAEPRAKNTAPAICLAALKTKERFGANAVLLVMPSDHKIEKINSFIDAVKKGYRPATDGYIVTFGVRPNYPETGYGYIEIGEPIYDGVFKVRSFTEKPTYEKAKEFVDSRRFFWNSGIFMFRADVILRELEKYTNIPQIMLSYGLGKQGLRKSYEDVPEISIDYAVCEKTDKLVCVPADFEWSDIGSFRAVKRFMNTQVGDNAGDAYFFDSEGCLYIRKNGKGIKKNFVFFGLKNIGVAEGKEHIVVFPLERDQEIKNLVDKLPKLKK